jgi:fatty acid desaturase
MFDAKPTPAEQIERIEAAIEELREAIRRSRRLVLVGRACAFAGAALFICAVIGLAPALPVWMIAGVAMGIGGLVLMGSSVGSTKQLELSLKRAETARNAAIDALEFVDLGDGAR